MQLCCQPNASEDTAFERPSHTTNTTHSQGTISSDHITSHFKFCDSPGQLQDPRAGIPQNCCGDCWGNCRGNSGCCGHCCGDSRFSAPQRKGSPAGSLRSSSPSTPSFPGSFPSSLRSSFGEFQLGGPVAGRGSRKT